MIFYALTRLHKQPYPAMLCDLDDFDDTSYGNDCADSVCFSVAGQTYFMYVDYLDVEEREDETAARYAILTYDVDLGELGDEVLLSTESSAAVVAWVNEKLVATDES